MSGQRYFYLDVISGVFIVQIIVMHVLQFSGLYNTGTAFDVWDSLLFFFMPWFYFKSGLFIRRSDDVKAQIRRDMYRLIVPYVIFTIIGSAVYACFDLYEGAKPLWKILLSPLWGVVKVGSAGGNLPLWFLLSLFWAHLLFYALPERLERPAVVVALLCGLALNKMDILLPFSLSTVFPGFVFLLLGKWCRNWLFDGEKLKFVAGGGKIWLFLIAFILLVYFFHPDGGGMRLNKMTGLYTVWILGAFLGCFLLCVLLRACSNKWIPLSVLGYLGRKSMVYYVLHWIPLFTAYRALQLWCVDMEEGYLFLILLIVVAMFLAVFTWKNNLIPARWLGEK